MIVRHFKIFICLNLLSFYYICTLRWGCVFYWYYVPFAQLVEHLNPLLKRYNIECSFFFNKLRCALNNLKLFVLTPGFYFLILCYTILYLVLHYLVGIELNLITLEGNFSMVGHITIFSPCLIEIPISQRVRSTSYISFLNLVIVSLIIISKIFMIFAFFVRYCWLGLFLIIALTCFDIRYFLVII